MIERLEQLFKAMPDLQLSHDGEWVFFRPDWRYPVKHEDLQTAVSLVEEYL